MAVFKPPSGTYSAALRARRRQRQAQPTTAGAGAVQIGNWLLADEAGDLVIINRETGAHILLVAGGDTE